MLTLIMQCTNVLKAALVFGFAAALLEGLPVFGLIFTVSNCIGAAMWAHGQSSIRAALEILSLTHGTIYTSKNTLSQLSGFTIGTRLGQTRIHKHCTPSHTQQNLTENCGPFAVMISHTKFELSEYHKCRIISNRSSPKYLLLRSYDDSSSVFFFLAVCRLQVWGCFECNL
jgi:hypothetical protein